MFHNILCIFTVIWWNNELKIQQSVESDNGYKAVVYKKKSTIYV